MFRLARSKASLGLNLRCYSQHPLVAQLFAQPQTAQLSQLSSRLSELGSTEKSSQFYRSLISHPQLVELLDSDEGEFDFFRHLLADIEAHSDAATSLILKNDVVSQFIGRDFSLIYTVKDSLNVSTLAQVLKHNPGRAKSSWDFYLEYQDMVAGSEQAHVKAIYTTLLEKLLGGEAHEQRFLKENNQVYQPSGYDIARCILLVKSGRDLGLELDSTVLCTHILSSGASELVRLVKPSREVTEKLLLSTSTGFPALYQYYLSQEFQPNPQVLMRALTMLVNSANELPSEMSQEIRHVLAQNGITVAAFEDPTLYDSLIERIQTAKLDAGSTPQALEFRLAILKSLGLCKRDFRRALDIFTSNYIIRELYHIDTVQSLVVKLCCLQALTTSQLVFLQVAQSFQNVVEGMKISDLQALIVTHAKFDVEKSLELYNDYIQRVPKKTEGQTLSPAAKITEALITGYLSQFDKEFAYLIHDGAVTNVVNTETERLVLKDLFKRFGKLITEENENDPIALKQIGDRMLEDYVEKLC
ncbi:hypothetical protein BABINDRAFT_160682 [Babjeviella inositovora NRRL Y-12698]|uniref:ATPase expression protein 1 n=1 Tax=Babjeviella inositovora NRRL Y-12698 TaxID=984486 RepID=A0A1E3QUE9_9ASCO|nr:uncharacterized protein BABINDRAFT_160682 [Babjeviella inositovora NRRL Y-12698]ODQ81321.1 hypothetical protein BABINDRAFT_160682 [Babjeviella inositovora NRRL Y-12698]